MPVTPHAALTPAMRKERVRQICNIMATLVEKTPGTIDIRVDPTRPFEISGAGLQIMAETLYAWLEDEGL